MAAKHSVGIDIGTHQIKVVVVRANGNKSRKGDLPQVIGTGYSESEGMRHGYIINTEDVSNALKSAVKEAEKKSGVRINEALVSIGGVSLEGYRSSGAVMTSRSDNEVTDYDISEAVKASEQSIPNEQIVNRTILHTIPLAYKLDGQDVMGSPEGMKGVKLSVHSLFVTCLSQHVHDLVEAVEDIGIEVTDVVSSPLAASRVTLNKAQKKAGCVLANIGSETVSIVVFDNEKPISLEVFPIGSTDITNDIALGLKVSLDEAEQIKLGGITGTQFSKQELDEIIVARLTDIFELIQAHLSKIKRDRLLPAGIIITGGGSSVASLEEMAREKLELPSKISSMQLPNKQKTGLQDTSWSVAYGLATLGLTGDTDAQDFSLVESRQDGFFAWLKRFLP